MRIIPAWLLKRYERTRPATRSEDCGVPAAASEDSGSDARSPPAAAFFQEHWYRSTYPDADRAIRSGRFASGIEHYYHAARDHAYSPSALFDEAFYRRRYPEAGRAVQAGEASSGLDHYLSVGAKLGYVPCPYFDSEWYAAVTPDFTDGSRSQEAISPFAHFVLHGQAEGRHPNALFEPSWYLQRYPRCRQGIEGGHHRSAFEHYCSRGAKEGLAASPYFFEGEYVRRHPDVAGLIRGNLYPNGFSHYILEGARAGLVGNPFFDDAAYLSLNASVAGDPTFRNYPSPLSHYAHAGARQGSAPHDLFDSVWYLSAYPDARHAIEAGDFDSPFAHFCSIGHSLGRRPGPLFDEVYYRQRYTDVADAIATGRMHSGFSHYISYGRKEGRGGHPFLPSLLLDALGAEAIPANWNAAANAPLRIRANLAELSTRDFFACADEIAYFRTLVEEFPAEATFRELYAYALLRSSDVAGAARAVLGLPRGGIERACLVSAIRRLAGDPQIDPNFANQVEQSLGDRLPLLELDEPLPTLAHAGTLVDLFLRGWIFHPCVRAWKLSIFIGTHAFPLNDGGLRLDVHRQFEALDTTGVSAFSGFHGGVLAPVDDIGLPGSSVMLELHAKSTEAIDGVERSFVLPLGELSIIRKARVARAPGTAVSDARAPVAICMAAFDPEPNLLARQIESIRAQTHQGWTLTISDESSDSVRSEELRRVVDGDSRMTILRSTKRRGFYFNFETALAGAPRDAEFIALADQDDYWYPEKLETLHSEVNRPGVLLVFADMRLVTPGGDVLADTFWTARENHWEDPVDLLLANTVTGAGSMFRSQLLEHILPFPVVSHLFHDQWIAMCAAATGRIRFVDAPLHDYVQHGNNVIGAQESNEAETTEWLRELYERVRNPKNLGTDFHTRLVAHCAREWGEEPARLSHVLAVLDSRTTQRSSARHATIVELLEKRGREPDAVARRRTPGSQWRIRVAQVVLDRAQADPAGMLRVARAQGAEAEKSRVTRRDCIAVRDGGAASGDAAEGLVVKVLPLRAVVDASLPERINFLVPELASGAVAGHSVAEFQLAIAFARRGRRVRVICVDRAGSSVAEGLEMERSFPSLRGFFDEVEVIFAFGRAEVIGFSPSDTVVATTWWTAHIAGKLVEKLERTRFLYLIQGYEPLALPMGSSYAMAHESYSLPHDALFSTSLLADYFEKHGIGVFGPQGGRALCFHDAISAFPDVSPAATRGPRRLVYCCPEGHAAQNMFEIGTAALRIAIQQGAFDGEEWEFWGLGTESKNLRLGPHHELRPARKHTPNKYREQLARFDVALSLMYTPHQSLASIEMAAAGLLVVSNTCENKTERELLAISDRFVPCVPTIDGVVAGLHAAVKRLRSSKGRKLNSVNWPQSWDEALNEGVMSFVDECLLPARVAGRIHVRAAASKTR